MFLEHGFENTTITDIAASIGMTRRTVYARFNDKRELFLATLENGAERMTPSTEELDAVETSNLRRALHQFVKLRADKMLTPMGIQMQRFIYAESPRFPDLVRSVYNRIAAPTTERVAALLADGDARGDIKVDDPVWAARSLMGIAIGSQITNALVTGFDTIGDVDSHIQRSLDLFLDGIRAA